MRLRVTMLEAMAETKTYMLPGRSCSLVLGGGAREAIVEVKDDSRCRMCDMVLLSEVSAEEAYPWRKRRATPIWEARRSVGVGELLVGEDSGGEGEGFECLVRRGGES